MKREIMIRIIIYSALAIFLIYAYRFKILSLINEFFFDDYVLAELSEEQKLEDFEEFYTTIIESVPYLEDVNKLYGIDFKKRKEYYIEEIKSTKNNVEYYAVMKAISEDLGSFHTDICFPLYSNLKGLNCYQSKEIVNSLGMQKKIDAWTEEIGRYIEEYENVEIISAVYVDGAYIVNNYTPFHKQDEKALYELVSINGITADEYVVKNLSVYGLQYDYLEKKPYRNIFRLNNKIGKPLTVVWKDKVGNLIEEKLFSDYGSDIVAGYGYLYNQESQTQQSESCITTYRDVANQLEYIKIDNFINSEGKQLKKYLQNLKYSKVIIDLRDNYGGWMDYAQKYIYPALYKKDANFSYQFLVPNTKSNKVMNNNYKVRFGYLREKNKDSYLYTNTITYKGKADSEKEIYYLVGSRTGSAADAFVNMIKENELGTVVGTNTGGEGLGASYICDYLKNSSLIYVYYPSSPIGVDTNPVGGTAPDVYVNQTQEDYWLERQYQMEGKADNYQNRLMYDTVLKWVIEQ